MNKKQLMVIWKIGYLLVLIFVFQPLSLLAEEQLPVNDILLEANESFTYNGIPIHPGLIKEFTSWISDPGLPTTISVDVAAPHGNEYSEGDAENRSGGYVYLKEEGGRGYLYYKWMGKLNNDIHVLQVGESGGGSGIFEDLLFVRFELDQGFADEWKPYDRLLMSIVGTYSLGDRDDGEIKVLSDRVIVGKSKYREEPVVLDFKKDYLVINGKYISGSRSKATDEDGVTSGRE